MKKKLTPIISAFLLASCTFSLPDIPKSSPTPSEAPLSSLEHGPSSEPSSSASGSSSSPKDSDDFAPEGYSLSWADEFDGESLNLDNWSYEIGNGNGGWGNQEAQYYTDHNDEVKDGKLIISAKKERVSDWDYTSTRIRTKGKVTTTYGYIAARIKLSAVAGLWPAFWMLP
ncbi:MAG: glycoside hydrolase family 16 protein, partial [Bacilli bacterium]|nr:glycoside hydrolase family 16 protein [Bacilli bacterium]